MGGAFRDRARTFDGQHPVSTERSRLGPHQVFGILRPAFSHPGRGTPQNPAKPRESANSRADSELQIEERKGPGELPRRTSGPAPKHVPNDLTTSFVKRLRAREPQAWFELWENFGPVLRSQLARWGRGRIGAETVKDLSQETLAALSGAIDRHDPSKGARFSTWLLAIARHTLGDEIDRRMAQKRGGGVRPVSLEDAGDSAWHEDGPDASYEREIFEAKVAASLRAAERDAGFADFNCLPHARSRGQSRQGGGRSPGDERGDDQPPPDGGAEPASASGSSRSFPSTRSPKRNGRSWSEMDWT